MKEYTYDKFNRDRRLTIRLNEEEHELLRKLAYETRKPINQIIIENLFKNLKNNFKYRLTD